MSWPQDFGQFTLLKSSQIYFYRLLPLPIKEGAGGARVLLTSSHATLSTNDHRTNISRSCCAVGQHTNAQQGIQVQSLFPTGKQQLSVSWSPFKLYHVHTVKSHESHMTLLLKSSFQTSIDHPNQTQRAKPQGRLLNGNQNWSICESMSDLQCGGQALSTLIHNCTPKFPLSPCCIRHTGEFPYLPLSRSIDLYSAMEATDAVNSGGEKLNPPYRTQTHPKNAQRKNFCLDVRARDTSQ